MNGLEVPHMQAFQSFYGIKINLPFHSIFCELLEVSLCVILYKSMMKTHCRKFKKCKTIWNYPRYIFIFFYLSTLMPLKLLFPFSVASCRPPPPPWNLFSAVLIINQIVNWRQWLGPCYCHYCLLPCERSCSWMEGHLVLECTCWLLGPGPTLCRASSSSCGRGEGLLT